MKHISYNEGKGAPLLFIGGWGQRLASPNTRWLLDTAAEAGYSVHACEIADAMTNFAADYLAPATALQTQLKPALILAHSTGGLIAAHLPHQERRVYMSPWWGIFGFKLRKWIRLVAKISSAVRWLPIDFTRDELGDLVTDGDWQGVPKTISPRFV
jgi:pimeloyl-ACP methyl ester carboxylesterase